VTQEKNEKEINQENQAEQDPAQADLIKVRNCVQLVMWSRLLYFSIMPW